MTGLGGRCLFRHHQSIDGAWSHGENEMPGKGPIFIGQGSRAIESLWIPYPIPCVTNSPLCFLYWDCLFKWDNVLICPLSANFSLSFTCYLHRSLCASPQFSIHWFHFPLFLSVFILFSSTFFIPAHRLQHGMLRQRRCLGQKTEPRVRSSFPVA